MERVFCWDQILLSDLGMWVIMVAFDRVVFFFAVLRNCLVPVNDNVCGIFILTLSDNSLTFNLSVRLNPHRFMEQQGSEADF